jgi:aspartate kinase
MIIMKFGGTSMEDAKAIANVADIVKKNFSNRPIVVCSACAGITNQLIKTASLAQQGRKDEALENVAAIESRHKKIVKELFEGETAKNLNRHLAACAEELAALVNGVAVLGELTPRSVDAFAAYGERLSSFLLHHCLEKINVRSVWIDARKVIITDDQYTRAVVQMDQTEFKLRNFVLPKVAAGHVVVTQGFIGATEQGITTTIGRGGSDYSAAIIGALIGADEIQIWTDVDGILTADPSVVKDARKIKVMSFNEASELAYFGARVLHPDTIMPAVKKNIPVRVLNSKRPSSTGTLIVTKPKAEKRCIVKSIAYKEGVTLIGIVSSRMFLAHGFLEQVFTVFDNHQTTVHTVATSEVSISVTVDNSKNLGAIVRELRTFATVTVAEKKAIICVVGDNLRNSPGVAARVLGAISEININMISQGASEINFSFVVDEDNVNDVVRRLHGELFSHVSALTEIFE